MQQLIFYIEESIVPLHKKLNFIYFIFLSTIKLITESDIDFSKFGWVNHVAKLINITPQKVSAFMKKYMSDFYKEKCFKRKSKIF